ATGTLLHAKAIPAHFDMFLALSGTSHGKKSPRINRWRNVAHQPARNLAGSAIAQNGEVVPLLRIFEDFRNGQQVWPVVSAGAKLDVVAGNIVSVDRTQARVVPGVYSRKPAIWQSDKRTLSSELTNLFESGFLIIQSERSRLFDDLLEISSTCWIPLAGIVRNADTSRTTAVDELRNESHVSRRAAMQRIEIEPGLRHLLSNRLVIRTNPVPKPIGLSRILLRDTEDKESSMRADLHFHDYGRREVEYLEMKAVLLGPGDIDFGAHLFQFLQCLCGATQWQHRTGSSCVQRLSDDVCCSLPKWGLNLCGVPVHLLPVRRTAGIWGVGSHLLQKLRGIWG